MGQKLYSPLLDGVSENDVIFKQNVELSLFYLLNMFLSVYLSANIHHYSTPVKAERIIVELGGYLNWREAYLILSRAADNLPFHARFISQELLDTESQIEAYIKEKNVNPFYEPGYALAHNYAGCRSFISPYYLDWGTIRYH